LKQDPANECCAAKQTHRIELGPILQIVFWVSRPLVLANKVIWLAKMSHMTHASQSKSVTLQSGLMGMHRKSS